MDNLFFINMNPSRDGVKEDNISENKILVNANHKSNEGAQNHNSFTLFLG